MRENTPPGAEAGAGDSTAPTEWTVFEPFHAEFRPRLLGFVRKLANDHEFAESALDTEGVVQDTFEQAWRFWATIDTPERWIFTVARRITLRHARWHIRFEEELRQSRGGLLQSALSDPVHAQAVDNWIMRTIMELPLNQRAATYLHRVEGWTTAEIAELLGIAPSTVGVHIWRGTERVRSAAVSVGGRRPCPRAIPVTRSTATAAAFSWRPFLLGLVFLLLVVAAVTGIGELITVIWLLAAPLAASLLWRAGGAIYERWKDRRG